MGEYIAEDVYDEYGSIIGVQDNGELIRCKDCRIRRKDGRCKVNGALVDDYDFCSWAVRKKT